MKALILEDNAPLAQILSDLLVSKAWDTKICSSCKEASQSILNDSFDLFLVDILLPDQKGFDFLELLSKKHFTKAPSVIIMSGFFDETSIMKKTPKNLKDTSTFFKKPINEKLLLKFLKKIKKTQDSSKKEEDLGDLIESFFEKDLPSKGLSFYYPEHQTFDSKDLIPLVFSAYLKKFTGNLTIILDNKEEGSIEFHKGDVVKVTSNDRNSYFGVLLVEHGLSLEEDIKTLLEDQSSNQPIGERLVTNNVLSPHMLNFILKEQIKIRLSKLMSSKSFTLNVLEKPLQQNQNPSLVFTDFDFLDWLADSLQTELDESFFKKFYLTVSENIIEKSLQINKTSLIQQKFLQKYNLFFQDLKPQTSVKEMLTTFPEETQSLRLLYFGLLTKSLYFTNIKKQTLTLKNLDFLLDSILEKDTDDLFQRLNLPWNASIKEVKNSYKLLIKTIHPESLPPTTSQELKHKCEDVFFKITESYTILKDETKRKNYLKKQEEEDFVAIMTKYETGLTKIKETKYKEALDIFREIKDHSHTPNNTILYILWAQIKLEEPNFHKNRELCIKMKQAIDSCSISLRTSALFWYVKALFFVQIGQYETAQTLLKKSLLIEKTFKEAHRDLLFVNNLIKQNKPIHKNGLFDFFFKKSS